MGEPLASFDLLKPVLDRRPSALLCDVDGTISHLAPTPDLARVTPQSRSLLRTISRSMLVAVVSGRDSPDLQRMLDLPDIVYISLHGLAWRFAGVEELAPEAREYQAHTHEAASELGHLKRLPGVVLEVKTVGLALHYRRARNQAAARAEILRAIASSAAAGRFNVLEGIRVVELRPPIGINKGVAVRRIVDRFNLRGLLYAGDDVTDLDAFRQVQQLRSSSGLGSYSLAVAHEETPQVVIDAADYVLAGIEGMEQLLAEIAAYLG